MPTRKHLAFGLTAVSVTLITVGVALIYLPAALIVLGTLCLSALWIDV